LQLDFPAAGFDIRRETIPPTIHSMSDMAENDPKAGQAAASEASKPAADRNGSPWWENPDAPPPPDPAAEIERLESEKADLTDRLVRLAAEMDNLRKRTERELTDARKYAVAKFAGDMLVVGDNLRRTLAAVPAERLESGDEVLKALSEGVQVTEREMERLLERNGITRIAAKGERFDPHRHQAMFEVPDASVPAGTITEVVQEGFQIGDRVLRAALVGISKGGPRAEARTEAAEERT
jgi:molecular chaperone GrpE